MRQTLTQDDEFSVTYQRTLAMLRDGRPECHGLYAGAHHAARCGELSHVGVWPGRLLAAAPLEQRGRLMFYAEVAK